MPIIYRQAAKILQQSSADKKVSIKALALAKDVQKKKATFALLVETIKYSLIIDKLINQVGIMTDHPTWWRDMVRVLVYDLAFGKGLPHRGLCGEVAKYKTQLNVALRKIRKQNKVLTNEELLSTQQRIKVLPRYVRVNTLKVSVEDAIRQFENENWEFRENGHVSHFEQYKKTIENRERREAQFAKKKEKQLKRKKKWAKYKWGHAREERKRQKEDGSEDDDDDSESESEPESEEVCRTPKCYARGGYPGTERLRHSERGRWQSFWIGP